MRVLHIGKYYPPFAGGIEHFLADLLAAHEQSGTTVAALVHNERRGLAGVRPDPAGSLPIYRAPCLGQLLYAPVSPTFPCWLDQSIRAFVPDLLHLHLPNTSAFAVLAIRRARRLPIVVHWHADVVASGIERRLALAYRVAYRPLEQRLLALSRRVIATSPPYLETSEALVAWRQRCEVIPLGVDRTRLSKPDRQTSDTHALWRGTGFKVLAIGRLTYYKGHEVLIRAAAQVPDSRVLIVGAGKAQAQLNALIQRLGLEARVRLLGFCCESKLQALLAGCDLLCLPSLERTEAFGLVLLEAMHHAKPLIVSDIPGTAPGWLVRGTGSGLTVPPGDAERLAEALRALQQDPQRRRVLGQRGAAALDGELGIRSVAAKITALYAHVLDEEYGARRRHGPESRPEKGPGDTANGRAGAGGGAIDATTR